MTKRNRKHAQPAAPANPRARIDDSAAKDAEHRLRGGELADDFADAERDSCIVIHHRDEPESDS